MRNPLIAIGLMSGTALDGIDVALLKTDGKTIDVEIGLNNSIEPLGPTGYRGYSEEEKALLRRAMRDAESIVKYSDRPGRLAEAETFVTRAHAEAVEKFLTDNNLTAADIDVIGFHGQTVMHRPDSRISIQIGVGQALASRLGIQVVSDFRRADIEAGGVGAPLVPIFHKALAEASGLQWPFGILNIGGVANATLIDRSGEIIAFDTGPGNALIDEWMQDRTNTNLDDGGRTAAKGRVDEAILSWLLNHPFFFRKPPKSLDRNWFSHNAVSELSTEDGAATLTAFTARAASRSLDHVAETPDRWIVAGGGARNGELIRRLHEALNAEIVTADAIGWSSAYMEAQAFAFIGVRSLLKLPITFPGTTGVSKPLVGGNISRPSIGSAGVKKVENAVAITAERLGSKIRTLSEELDGSQEIASLIEKYVLCEHLSNTGTIDRSVKSISAAVQSISNKIDDDDFLIGIQRYIDIMQNEGEILKAKYLDPNNDFTKSPGANTGNWPDKIASIINSIRDVVRMTEDLVSKIKRLLKIKNHAGKI